MNSFVPKVYIIHSGLYHGQSRLMWYKVDCCYCEEFHYHYTDTNGIGITYDTNDIGIVVSGCNRGGYEVVEREETK